MTNFITELQQMNKYSSLDANPQSNPNDNYELLEQLLVHARDKHLHIENVKYRINKHKLNKWMTNGIFKSISRKYIFYEKIVQASTIMLYITFLKQILIPIKIYCDKIIERQINFIITKHFYSIKIIFKKLGPLLKNH